MKVVGYTYDADMHCVDCTRKMIREFLAEVDEKADEVQYGDNIEEYVEDYMNGSLSFKDSEGNDIHPVFDTDEAGDTPDHCGDCGAFLDTSWTSETMDYAYEALADYVLNDDGNVEALDEWADHLEWCIGESTLQKLALQTYKGRRVTERWISRSTQQQQSE